MILCCGEALIDMIPAPTTTGGEGFVPHAGGAVFNTAIALARLEAPTGLLTGLSTDMFGQMLDTTLADNGVARDMIVRSDRPSTLGFCAAGRWQRAIHLYGRELCRADAAP